MKLIAGIVLCSSTGFIHAQSIRLSAKVRDINTHRAISYANVFIVDTQIGTTTDQSGNFILNVPAGNPGIKIRIQHIAYYARDIGLDSLQTTSVIFLQPRIIPMTGLAVEAERVQMLDITKDLPQTVAVITAKEFEIRGYADAGDLLRTDQSVQIDEELSGRKLASIRGGNADEVIVLYDGVRMNNTYDNVFDLSQIDLDDLDRFEIIKGSNTALYGPEAFAGVVNIVPKFQQDYLIRFQQRFGSYQSGKWGLHLYKNWRNLHAVYSIKKSGAIRTATGFSNAQLVNETENHTGSLVYDFSGSGPANSRNTLGLMFFLNRMDYDNQIHNENLVNSNDMVSLHYTGNLGFVKNVDLSASYRKTDEGQFLLISDEAVERTIDNKSYYVYLEKRFYFRRFDLLLAYQHETGLLDFTDDRSAIIKTPIGVKAASFTQHRNGFVSILKYHAPTGSDFFNQFDINLSYRYDGVSNSQDHVFLRDPVNYPFSGIFDDTHWKDSTVKFSVNLAGGDEYLATNGFINVGNNVKFPTLFQQISSPQFITPDSAATILSPETNNSIELGFNLTRKLPFAATMYGWQISASYFQNNYSNKLRTFFTPGFPVAFYDNVRTAKISGFEFKPGLFLLHKKVTLEAGVAKYNISNKAAFPFKFDYKHIINLFIDHLGYAFQMHLFREGEQTGVIRLHSTSSTTGNVTDILSPELQPEYLASDLAIITLPAVTNMDLHLSKQFHLKKLKLYGNISLRNILKNDLSLQGIALRDRRYYVTLGIQY